MIVKCEKSFIKFYKIIKEQLKQHSHFLNNFQIFFSFQLKLILINEHYYNLLISFKITAFISDKQKNISFYDIVISV